MKKHYITDLIEKTGITKDDLFYDDYYSIIAGGVRPGKSTFLTKGLDTLLQCQPGEILMTAPLTSIVNQLVAKGIVNKKTSKDLLETGFFELKNVTVCTYAALKNAIEGRKELLSQLASTLISTGYFNYFCLIALR